MNYDFDERTDEPKRYCQPTKLSQQEMPKVDEPRCINCCERLVVGVNWLQSRRRYHTSQCKNCESSRVQARKHIVGGSRLASIKYRGLARYIACAIRSSASRRNKAVGSIDEIQSEIERFLQTGCAICGCALRLRNAGEDGSVEGCLQVDRIDPGQGYIVGNMQGLCPNCNNLKGHHTLETAERLYKHLLAHEYKRKYGFELHHLPVKPTLPAEPPEVPTRG